MTKRKHSEDSKEKMRRAWSPEARARLAAKYMDRIPTDPTEDEIYNVLCPQIRASWSPYVEYEHTVVKNQSVELTPIPDSVLLGT